MGKLNLDTWKLQKKSPIFFFFFFFSSFERKTLTAPPENQKANKFSDVSVSRRQLEKKKERKKELVIAKGIIISLEANVKGHGVGSFGFS